MINQNYIRSVKQGCTPTPVSTTTMAAATLRAYDAMVAAEWQQAAGLASRVPQRHYAQVGAFNDQYDAFKFCSDYANGFQNAYAGAVCYTYRVPADAFASPPAALTRIEIPAWGDRWLADGCSVSIHTSPSQTPPTWADVLALPPGPTLLAGQMAVTPDNSGPDSDVTLAFDLSATPLTPLAYIHIVVRLTDYLTHRGAWIEGSAMIDGANVDWTYDRPVSAPVASGELILPLRLYAPSANRTPVTFSSTDPVNLESLFFRRHWTAAMLRGGEGTPAAPDSLPALTPEISGAGLTLTAKGHISKVWCPVSAIAGLSAWFRAVGTWPASPMRLSLFKGDDMPAIDAPSTWDGTGDDCIGTALFTAAAPDELLRLPLLADGASPLWLVCAYADVAATDSTIGDATSGISLIDAHISLRPVTRTALPHFVKIGKRSVVSLMVDAMNDPGLLSAYAYSAAHYVARGKSSLPWLTPDNPPTSDITFASLNVQGSDNNDFAVVIDNENLVAGKLRIACAGTLPMAASSFDNTGGFTKAVALAYGTLAALNGSGVISAGGQVLLADTINNASITGAFDVAGHGTCLLWLSGYPGTPTAVGTGLNPSFTSAVSSLTDVISMAIGAQRAVFLHYDGTVTAINRQNGDADTSVSGWTNITAIATSGTAILGLVDDGTLVVANGSAYADMENDVLAINDTYIISNILGATDNGFTAAIYSVR